MQEKHAIKMPLGIAIFLLLTLQAFELVSTQTNQANPEDEWKQENGVMLPEEDLGISFGSSGDGEYQTGNKTVRTITEQYDNTSTTPSTRTTMDVSSNTTETNITLVYQNDTSNTVTENPTTQPPTTNGSHVNITETNTLSPENYTTNTTNYTTAPATTTNVTNNTSTTTDGTNNTTTTTDTSTTAFNITETPKSTVSENFTTTASPPFTNNTSPGENSTNTTVSTMTTIQTTESTTLNNITEGSFNSRGNLDRGLTSDTQQQSKGQAWGAILGIGVAVSIVALVIYAIVKRRNYRDFSHRKLVEDIPHEPVLRLDNSEPLDLKFDGFAYYNPRQQGDNIQMTNFPKGHIK